MNGLVSGYGSDSDDEDANNTEESKSTGMKSVKKLYLVNFWKRFFLRYENYLTTFYHLVILHIFSTL